MSTQIVHPEARVILTDSIAMLHHLLGDLRYLSPSDPDVFMDVKSANIGQCNRVAALVLYIVPKKRIYLIDIQKLGSKALTTSLCGISLQRVLESPIFQKGVFDVQIDSHYLFSNFQISLEGICDVQLMELAAREGSKEYLSDLSRCIDGLKSLDATHRTLWDRQREAAEQYFIVDQGQKTISGKRPIPSTLLEYYAGNVVILPSLYDAYQAKLTLAWKTQVQHTTKDMVTLSRSPDFELGLRLPGTIRGPWSTTDIQRLAIPEPMNNSQGDFRAKPHADDLDEAFRGLSIGFARHKFKVPPFLQLSMDDLCQDLTEIPFIQPGGKELQDGSSTVVKC